MVKRNFPGISRVFLSLLFALVVAFLCGSFIANSPLTISHVAGPGTLLRLFLSFNSPLEVSDEDQALFKEAIAVANDPTSLALGTRKIAFLYLTRGPLPLAPLWSRFFRGHEGRYSVYIHANPDYTYAPNELPFPFQGREIPNGAVQWGGRLMVAAERRLLAQGLLDRSNWYFVLLSESCIPLFPFDTVAAYITRSPYSFITTVVAPSLWRVDMLPDVPLGRWRKGDQWKEVHRSLALEVVRDTRLFRKFTLHCHCSGCSWHKVGLMDEHYIPTLLHTIAGSRLANRSLTFVDWKNHEDYVHPHRFNATEVNEGLLRELRGITIFHPFSSEEYPALDCSTKGESRPCFMFARKFAADTLQPLLKLSADVLGY